MNTTTRLRRFRPGNGSSPPPRPRARPRPTRPLLSPRSFVPDAVRHPCTALSSFFAAFGTLLSTHQVPSLLVTAFIICSLLSPSLLLYFVPSPAAGPGHPSVSPLTTRGRGELVWELEGLQRQGLISTEEPVCWDRVKMYYQRTGREQGGRRLRVEQILVNVNLVRSSSSSASGSDSHSHSIAKDILHKAYKLEQAIQRRLRTGSIPHNDCLREPGLEQNCAVLSPTKWWKDEQSLLGDPDVHETLSRSTISSSASNDSESLPPTSLPLTLSETFVGAGFDKSGTVKTAQHLILTFFLQDVTSRSSLPLPTSSIASTPSAGGGGGRQPLALHPADSNSTVLEDLERDQARQEWRKAVREVIEGFDAENPAAAHGVEQGSERIVLGLMSESKVVATRHVLLKFLPHLVVDAHPRRLENIIYAFGYFLVIVYVARYIRRLRAHSKMGLIITGIAELSSSGIMSVSICWLMGWSLGLVPWNLMAFLVLTSGLDNMILVLRAISQTDLNLTVPERMAVGLKQVGVEMTVLLMVEELIAAWLLWFVEITVMRQWIRFGAVVLAVDYFLELTFFSTVLSIDIQRLELADLLAHNTSSSDAGSVKTAATAKSTALKKSSSTQESFEGFVRGSWKVLKDRPAKTSTVAFLWIINVLLWAFYGSEHYLPATCSQTALSSDRPFLAPSLDPSVSRALRLGQTDPSAASHLSVPLGSGQAFWDLVNPHNASSVQVYLEPTISVQLFDRPTSARTLEAHSNAYHDDDLYRSPAPESVQLNRGSAAGIVAGGGVAGVTDEGEVGVWTRVAIVVLPILMVMGLLRLLLVYLLKDAELLQARWGSEERVSGREKGEDAMANGDDEAEVELVKGIESGTRQHAGDVELVASGGDVIVSWAGLEEEIKVRRRNPGPTAPSRQSFEDRAAPSSFATRLHIPLAAEPVSLVSLSVEPEGKFCAAVTHRGRIFVWALERGGTLVDFGGTDQPRALSIASSGPPLAKELKKGEAPAPPLPSTGPKHKSTINDPCFYSLHAEGKVVRWNCASYEAVTLLERRDVGDEEEEIVRRQLIVPTNSFDGTANPLLAQTYKDGRLQLVRLESDASRRIVFDLPAEAGGGTGSIVALSTFPVVSSVVGLVIEESIVTVSRLSTGLTFYSLSPSLAPTPIASIPPLEAPIRQVRLTPGPADATCSSCLEAIPDGFLVSVSTRSRLVVFRLYTPPISASVEVCSCNSSAEAVEVSRSRASSFGIVGGSPAMTRVLSNGATTGRRFSPRKKPTTPTRLVAFNSNPSTTMSNSANDPFLSAAQPNASSSSSDSSLAGTPAQDRKASFSTQRQLSPAPAPPKRTSSGTSLDDTSPASTVRSSPESPPDESAPLVLRVVEVATAPVDERGGWEVLGGDRLVGVRRRKGDQSGTGRGWEVWTLSLGRNRAGIDEGYRHGSTWLGHLLDPTGTVEESFEGDAEDYPRLPPPSAHTLGLRRRHVPHSSSPLGRIHQSSPYTPSNQSPSLPFSRVGPLAPSLAASATTIALGNRIITLSSLSKDTSDKPATTTSIGPPPPPTPTRF
ncbi:hypothetical protein JCM11491_004352 [Sporobolomyces phaffii]